MVFVKGQLAWNKGKYEKEFIVCKNCGKKFKPKKPYLIKQVKFCSHKCYSEFIKGLPSLNKGRKHTEQAKKNMRDGNNGHLAWNKGKTDVYSEKTLKKMSNKKIGIPTWNKGLSGEKMPNWKGGLSYLPYSVDWTEILRESIRQRDNHICYECETHQDELDRKLAVHHIDYNKQNCDPENLISLCRSCHTKTNFNREYWINYFKQNNEL